MTILVGGRTNVTGTRSNREIIFVMAATTFRPRKSAGIMIPEPSVSLSVR
jgi:hypothetical protein